MRPSVAATPPRLPGAAAVAIFTPESVPPAGPPRPLDRAGQDRDQFVDVGRGRRVAEGEPQRGTSPIIVGTHREQDVRGLGDAGRAGRTGRARDPGRVEQQQEGIAGAAREREVGVARQAIDRVAVEQRIRNRCPDPCHQLVPERRHGRRIFLLAFRARLDGSGEPDDAGHVQRARTDVALLSPAMQQRRAGDVPAEQQCADTDRATEFVPGHRHRGHPGRGEVRRHLTDGLDGIGVHQHARLGGDGGQGRHRLYSADLVIGPHGGDERDISGVTERVAQGLGLHPSDAVDRQPADLRTFVPREPLDRVQHGVVFDAARHDPVAAVRRVTLGPEDALHREVVGLRAAAGEDHLGRTGAESGRNGLA